MALVSILVATLAAWLLGAVWYTVLSKPWLEVSGVPRDAEGRPMGRPVPLLFAGGALCLLVVAGMMRHMLASAGITAPFSGLVAGAGVGLFFITPWLAMNTLYASRPLTLAAIDGGYATLACAAMGLALTLF